MRLSKLTKAWFPLPDDPDQARFEIKHLLSGDLNSIVDRVQKEEIELVSNEQGGIEPAAKVIFRQKIAEELTVLAAIVDWEHLYDPEGKHLECSEENKKRLCRELPEADWKDFLKFIAESRVALAEQVRKQEEGARKN